MKLLLDENLSRRRVPFLQDDYPDTSQVALLGLEQASDREIWQFARTHGYVLVTQDSDFRDLAELFGSPPQVLLLKIGNSSKVQVLSLLQERKAQIEAELADGTIRCLQLTD
ncbi:DUF5615 family PIN-like protein [Flagellatimonas centrodinii]|uniref:DUF5615 family PIN-like protein n=1 Tax=Flagellatimonas centrodinii TaxID=2806210 RepID=UPI001FED3F6F|nr:DUF5615 family PIN-like protein [Flagellatimonas centrodinii]ULQ47879.1 DUF5615 family PIN-like protein [Flagellatimonas centrodinii]